MTIEAEIIADSMSPAGVRLTTMQLRYPRFIHAEFMTHRVFSRNASSSRAIPVERLVGSKPIHASPAEHQGTPDEGIQHSFNVTWTKPHLHGNFNGWIQHRKILELEIK